MIDIFCFFFLSCREPGCGKEMPDPGTMWRHYQEYHNNEAHAFVCPYTSCNNSLHNTSENLAEHIQNSHRQPPTLPTEPEIICFEGPTSETVDDDDDASRTIVEDDEDEQDDQEDSIPLQNEDDDTTDHEKEPNRFINNSSIQTRKNTRVILNKNLSINHEIYKNKEERLIKSSNCDTNITTGNTKNIEDYITSSHKNKNQDDTFYHNNIYEENTGLQKIDDTDNFITDNEDEKLQDHRIDLGNLESVFRSGLEGDVKKIEVNNETVGNCSDDEEYTPKKQRMSRFKKDEQPYKCDINGCGKTYKYISHYRHHQDSHKIQDNNTVDKQLPKSPPSRSRSKASTVSFFL